MPFRRRNWCGCIQVNEAFYLLNTSRLQCPRGALPHIELHKTKNKKLATKEKINYEMSNFSIKFVAKNICSHYFAIERRRKKKIGIRSGQEKVQRSKHLIFECKKSDSFSDFCSFNILLFSYSSASARVHSATTTMGESFFSGALRRPCT